MSDVNTASVTPVRTASAMKPNTALIMGRIESSRFYDGTRYTLIMTPAPDQYSRPQIIQVRSKTPIGTNSDEVSVLCKLGGFQGKAYEVKDKKTGEVSTITSVVHTFDAVE